MVMDELRPQQTHETSQEVLRRDIEEYQTYLKDHHAHLARLRTDLETTRAHLEMLKSEREKNPDDLAVAEHYKNAALHFSELHHVLFENPDNIRIIREIPEMETELKTANAKFLRELH